MSLSIRTSLFIQLFLILQTGPAFGGYRHDDRVYRFLESYSARSYNKCGFHILAHYFSLPTADATLKSVLQLRPPTDTSILSGSGLFRIHFDTSGINRPFLYDSLGQKIAGSTLAFIDSVAAICDHVYRVEVDSLGFPPPPSDSGAGGGNEYDIYIQDLPYGTYGFTDWDNSRPITNRANPTYAAWMVLRNEFQSTYTKGIQAIEVTVAHEFHHGIQIGNYGLWENDLYFYELTSTWMEQVVYPGVRDYYQYLPNFFANTDKPFNLYEPNSFAGYERCVFGIFIQHQYGAPVMRGIWEEMSAQPVIPAIEAEFSSIHVNPVYAFQLFSEWNYFTGYRSAAASQSGVSSYPDAASYPLVTIDGTGSLTSAGVSFTSDALRMTEHFYRIGVGPDSIGLAVVNSNLSAAANYDSTSFSYTVGIASGGSNCVRQLYGGYCIDFLVSDYTDWGVIPFISNGALISEGNNVFPQPFNPSIQTLKIPYPFPDLSGISLSIYSASGLLIDKETGDGNLAFSLNGKYYTWDGKDRNGKLVGTGVYIYVLTGGSKSVVGKIAVVRN